MPKNPNAEEAAPQADPNARLVVTAENRSKAQRWFERARELGDKRQYDHAIQYYVEGLEYWPDAVEEGCKPLHGCAVARKHNGGAKPGLKDQMKHPVKHKEPLRAFLNSMWLFGHDPDNVGYIEAAARTAAKLRADDAAMWAAGVLYKALEGNPKTSAKHFQALLEAAEELGDRAAARNEQIPGETAYQLGINAIHVMRRRFPKSRDMDLALRNLSTKLTIHKGKYQGGESYRESIADAEEQAELHDLDRVVQSQDRVVELTARAEQEYAENPDVPGAFQKVIDLLRRQETDEAENKAIGLLVQEYKKTGDFRWKMMAQDVRIKQLGRLGRRLQEEGDAEAIRKHTIDQLKFELSSYRERVEQYPTDNRLKYEYAVRTFKAGRFDDAIPMFQAARVDPKNRASCALHLGRCFYRKGFLPEAMASLSEGLKEHEFDDDDLAKSMLYWLGRAQEDARNVDAARKTYGRLLQVDYNYKDVRARMEGLPAGG